MSFERTDTRLLNAGEFAELCDIAKSTLRFYRDEQILEPEHVAENGYTRYAPLQGLDIVGIKALEDCGLGLDRIKAMRDSGSKEVFPYADVLKRMEREQRVLGAKIAMLEEARRVAEGAESPAFLCPSERPADKYYLWLAYRRPSSDIEYNLIHSVKLLFRLSREYLGTSPFLFGRTVKKEDLLSGSCHKVDGLVVPVSEALALSGTIPGEHLYRAEAGRTVCARYSGKPYSYRGPYEKLLAGLKKKKLTVAGDVIELWAPGRRPGRRGENATLIEVPVL